MVGKRGLTLSVKDTPFDSSLDLVFIVAWVMGKHGKESRLRLVVDTGAAITIVTPDVLDSLGYSAREAEARTIIRSAVAEEPGYLIRVTQFRALGYAFEDFRVHAHDLPEGYDIDGLLGWDFLQRFNLELRPREGLILTSPISDAS